MWRLPVGAGRVELSRTVLLRQQVTLRASLFLRESEKAFNQGAFDVALRLADSAGVHAPELADIPYLQGLILTELGQIKQAQAAYQRVVSLDPYYRSA